MRNRTLPFEPRSVEAAILSHAHIDHSGNLPNLVKSGFNGPIYATRATAHLANIMLLDSGHIQEMDAAYVNKRTAQWQPACRTRVEPIYTMEDAAQVAQNFCGLDYDERSSPSRG